MHLLYDSSRFSISDTTATITHWLTKFNAYLALSFDNVCVWVSLNLELVYNFTLVLFFIRNLFRLCLSAGRINQLCSVLFVGSSRLTSQPPPPSSRQPRIFDDQRTFHAWFHISKSCLGLNLVAVCECRAFSCNLSDHASDQFACSRTFFRTLGFALFCHGLQLFFTFYHLLLISFDCLDLCSSLSLICFRKRLHTRNHTETLCVGAQWTSLKSLNNFAFVLSGPHFGVRFVISTWLNHLVSQSVCQLIN